MPQKIILKGNKVILRPPSIKDARRFCGWIADREVTRFLSIYDQAPLSLKEEKDWIRKSRRDKNNFRLAIDTVDGVHIGTVGLNRIDQLNKRAEYGVFIGDKKYWGQGYGTEAGKLIIEYGFKKLKLHRIFLQVIAYNIRGIKSYQKIGFKLEGRSRQHVWRNGFWHDKIWMGLLKSEFIKSKNK
ncbi:MAG: GNAT family protein [Patescibacteria group bacterium]|jgi:RimJ/RimL family protein N-acetyltransferase